MIVINNPSSLVTFDNRRDGSSLIDVTAAVHDRIADWTP